MDLTEALEFWQENQLRFLVLASLAIQWFLYVFARFRAHRIPGLLRLFIWLAYVGNDAVAIYALATLFNSCRHDRSSSDRPVAQLMWAPILLVHLGGQDSISAYNIEDNELWRRHVLTAASQAAAAIYVFVKPWPKINVTTTHQVVGQATIDDAKTKERTKAFAIAYPAVSLFFCGITKCVCKIRDLKTVSVNSLVDSSVPQEKGEREIISLQDYVGAATHGRGDPTRHVQEIWKPYNLCVDLAPPYSARLSCLKHLVYKCNPDEAHRLVKTSLAATFHRLYTKVPLRLEEFSNPTKDGFWQEIFSAEFLRFLVILSMFTGTLVFCLFISRRTDQDPTDMIITYVLLGSALVMEFYPTLIYDKIGWIEEHFTGYPAWPDQVARYNLMGYLARSRKHSWLMKMAGWLSCRNLVDQLWTMKPCKVASSQEITALVHGHVAGGWTGGHMAGPDSFRAFNDYRGQWTLGRELAGVGRCIPSIVLMSVSRPFDESVLVWHLATDFCYHLLRDHEDASSSSSAIARRCREMSNYMAYLLFVKPEMLMPGARRNLFSDVCGGLVDVLQEDPPHEPRDLAQKVIQVLQRDGDQQAGSVIRHAWSDEEDPPHEPRDLAHSVICQAWSVAKDLMDSLREDEEKLWRVIQGVWVEMLCFSASRCKGYLHAKSLGTGGEYLSYAWLLLLYMGMETLAEKMQRTELYAGHMAAASSVSGQNA